MTSSSAFSFLQTGHDSYQEESFSKIGDEDVIFGRGGKTFGHPGNRLFRRLVFHNKDLYETLKNLTHRQFIALSIVRSIQRSGGKFMKKKGKQELWSTVSTKEACIKTSQALRDANVRTKRESKMASRNQLIGLNNGIEREQAVVSPTQSADVPPQLIRKVTQPDASTLHSTITEPVATENKFHEIDHIEMETIHTLVRSLGGNAGSSKTPPVPRMHAPLPRNSHPSQHESLPKQTQCQPGSWATSNRLSVTIRDLMSKQTSNENKQQSSANRSPSFRCSITSLSMLDPSLFNADLDLEDFEIDETLATQV